MESEVFLVFETRPAPYFITPLCSLALKSWTVIHQPVTSAMHRGVGDLWSGQLDSRASLHWRRPPVGKTYFCGWKKDGFFSRACAVWSNSNLPDRWRVALSLPGNLREYWKLCFLFRTERSTITFNTPVDVVPFHLNNESQIGVVNQTSSHFKLFSFSLLFFFFFFFFQKWRLVTRLSKFISVEKCSLGFWSWLFERF